MDKTTTEEKKKQASDKPHVQLNGNGRAQTKRLPVKKTYKLYIGGKFPRSESGRYYKLTGAEGDVIANICRSSRKDFREAVVVARKSLSGWSGKSAYNRSQILYRVAETLEGRKAQFIATLITEGLRESDAVDEVTCAIDRIVYYAGWCDKYQQVFSSVNPVESSHFNFSFPEPTGVVSALAPPSSGLAGLVSLICPVIAGGNTIIILAHEKFPLSAIELGEVLQASDVPGGVVNILTGFEKELFNPFSNHMDVNAVVYCGTDEAVLKTIQTNASLNVKRVIHYPVKNWLDETHQNPYMIMDFQEIKTTWHPVGI